MNEEDFYDWEEHEDDRLATAPVPMSALEQLQKYQLVIRKICPFLDPYETTVLMQILDRITGWKKLEAYVNTDKLLNGDAMWGGIARAMHRSRMSKALATLEERGVIRRRSPRNRGQVKIYRVNLDVDLSGLEASGPKLRAARPANERRNVVSEGDLVVSQVYSTVSSGEIVVSSEDPREGYGEKNNLDSNQDNSRHPKPTASDARSPEEVKGRKLVRPARARPGPRYEINPRARRRPPT